MSRDVIELTISDLSQFCKTLRADLPQAPGHAQMLGLIAKAAGYRNYQHLKARNAPKPAADQKQVDRALRCFDARGLFASWPARVGTQLLCVWAIWARLPPREVLNERQISACIDELCSLRDAARVRRTLVEMKLFERTRDGSAYRRLERPVPPEAEALIAALKARRKQSAA
jgi:hypothetical protein